MRLPIKYEILFIGKDIQATIDIGLNQFTAVYRHYIYTFYDKGTSMGNNLKRHLNIYLKTKGIDAIEVDRDPRYDCNGCGWYLPQYEEPTDMLFLEFKVLEQGRGATPRQVYTEVKKCLAYITEYIFNEMFSPYSFPYRLMSDIGTYRDILSNMNHIVGDEDFSDDFSFDGIARGTVRFAYYELWDNNTTTPQESRTTPHIKF
jgi:hypothetical protein